MHWKANATEHKCNGMLMQQNAKEMLCKRFFSTNATERKHKRHSMQMEWELFIIDTVSYNCFAALT